MIKKGNVVGIDILLGYSEKRFIDVDLEMELDGKIMSLRQVVEQLPKTPKNMKIKKLFLNMKPYVGEDPAPKIKVEDNPMVENNATIEVDDNFKLTFEDVKVNPIVKLERLEDFENVAVVNSSGMQDTNNPGNKRGRKRKRPLKDK